VISYGGAVAALDAFRSDRVADDEAAMIRSADIVESDVAADTTPAISS
jgi:hypothetical protein